MVVCLREGVSLLHRNVSIVLCVKTLALALDWLDILDLQVTDYFLYALGRSVACNFESSSLSRVGLLLCGCAVRCSSNLPILKRIFKDQNFQKYNVAKSGMAVFLENSINIENLRKMEKPVLRAYYDIARKMMCQFVHNYQKKANNYSNKNNRF